MSRLEDGQSRKIKPGLFAREDIEVVAERVDADTPYVHLHFTGRVGRADLALTDAECAELIERLQRALNVLPSSK